MGVVHTGIEALVTRGSTRFRVQFKILDGFSARTLRTVSNLRVKFLAFEFGAFVNVFNVSAVVASVHAIVDGGGYVRVAMHLPCTRVIIFSLVSRVEQLC